jgi:hypothetical protein
MTTETPKVAVFDASPLNEPTDWMIQACRRAGVFLADIDAIAKLLADNPESRRVLAERGPRGPDPELAGHYRSALDELAAGQTRVAVHSVVWIDYGLVPDAAVLDFDPLEAEQARVTGAGIGSRQADRLAASVRESMESHVANLAPGRLLVLPGGVPDAQKAELAAAHLSKYV